MIQTITVDKAKQDLAQLVSNADKKRNEYMITVGKSSATIIATQELESLRETLAIMSNPKIMKEIKEAEDQVKKGEVITFEEFEKELKENV